jgi:hypothetical protein
MGRLLYVVFDDSNLFDLIDSSLMMEAVRISEMSVDNHFTRQYIPEDNSEHMIEYHTKEHQRDLQLWQNMLSILATTSA